MAKKKLIKAFDGSNYSVFEINNLYCVYDKSRKGVYTNSMYIGCFTLSDANKAYIFQDNKYYEIPSLIKAMEEYNNTLPFSHELYNPVYKKSYFIELCLHEYLQSVGLTYKNGTYIIEDMFKKAILSLVPCIEDDSMDGHIEMSGESQYSWTEIEFHDLDSAIAACNSLIAPYSLTLCSNLVKSVTKLRDIRTKETINKISLDLNKLEMLTYDMRDELIGLLEKELKELRSVK